MLGRALLALTLALLPTVEAQLDPGLPDENIPERNEVLDDDVGTVSVETPPLDEPGEEPDDGGGDGTGDSGEEEEDTGSGGGGGSTGTGSGAGGGSAGSGAASGSGGATDTGSGTYVPPPGAPVEDVTAAVGDALAPAGEDTPPAEDAPATVGSAGPTTRRSTAAVLAVGAVGALGLGTIGFFAWRRRRDAAP